MLNGVQMVDWFIENIPFLTKWLLGILGSFNVLKYTYGLLCAIGLLSGRGYEFSEIVIGLILGIFSLVLYCIVEKNIKDMAKLNTGLGSKSTKAQESEKAIQIAKELCARVEKETNGAIVLELNEYSASQISFHTRLTLVGRSEHYSCPADAVPVGFFDNKNFAYKLAKRIFQINGVDSVWVERYSILVKAGGAFKREEIFEQVYRIVRNYVEVETKIKHIDPDIQKFLREEENGD